MEKDNVKPKKKSKIKWIIIAVIAIIVIAAVSGGGSGDDVKKVNNSPDSKTETNTTQTKDNDSDSKEKSTTEPTSFTTGDTAEYKDIQVTLEKVIKSKGDGNFVKPGDGNEFVLCVFKIKNNSDTDITISSLASFEAYFDDSSINSDYLGLQTDEAKKYNSLDGDIASGKKMEGIISYEVPKNWKKLEINVSPDTWSSKKITFVVKNK